MLLEKVMGQSSLNRRGSIALKFKILLSKFIHCLKNLKLKHKVQIFP